MEQTFETLPSEELFRIPKECRNASFTAGRSTLGFERIEHDQPEIDLTRPFTLSPYPNEGQLYRAYANKEDERAARWLLFFFSTYLHEGHIRFRKLDDATLLGPFFIMRFQTPTAFRIADVQDKQFRR